MNPPRLLVHNDDRLFPEFRGHDLNGLGFAASLQHRAVDGSTVAGLAEQARGVAPDASVLAIQVFTPTPTGPTTSVSEVLDAFEWAYEQRARFAIAAINLSVASAAPSGSHAPRT